jgi:hypothetical protein
MPMRRAVRELNCNKTLARWMGRVEKTSLAVAVCRATLKEELNQVEEEGDKREVSA